MTKLVLTRARAITNEVLYAAGVDDDADAAEPMTKAYQFFHGKWQSREFPVATQRIALYHRPKGGRIAVYMSRRGEMFSPEPSFRSGPIINEAFSSTKKLGYLSDLRQVGKYLFACGGGGQTYRQHDDGSRTALDLSLFDDFVDSNWVFSIRAPGNTGREQDAYWDNHPSERAELDRRLSLLNKNLLLNAINGPSIDGLYVCGQKGVICFCNGQKMEKLEVPTSSFLLDILVEDEDTIWICGRDGTLLRGNARQGFTLVPCEERPMFSTITRFNGKIYLSSYANPRGVFVYDGQLRQVASGLRRELNDVHTVDAIEGALWVVGSKDIARFDGTSWERIKMPKWSD
ncbi:hypothetical protein [Methylobacterium sp. Leaf469]|uniref:hypothetical protein n=1 Tax=Methylobacterium sp. Leaf469 TaxID=1736387 RepID=UPI000A90AEB8|nr:hypothetical protein [Methylobacterium sp. Leaf469]